MRTLTLLTLISVLSALTAGLLLRDCTLPREALAMLAMLDAAVITLLLDPRDAHLHLLLAVAGAASIVIAECSLPIIVAITAIILSAPRLASRREEEQQ